MQNLLIFILVQTLSAASFAIQQTSHFEYINKFEANMNELVLGQPEAVDAFIDLEKATIFSGGERPAPELIFLLGLPGTGKDTLVESYVKTKHKLKYGNTNRNILIDHVFNVPKLINETDMMVLTGSTPGLVDSDKMPPLIKWLVLHSGGRYYISMTRDQRGQITYFVNENLNWKPGEVLPGYFAPEDGVLFVNELHDWKKEYKNLFLKEALEKGKFVIANAKDGVPELFIPINIVIASNDGIGLIADRDAQGRPNGRPLAEEQLMKRWKRAVEDPDNIKRQIRDISEELLSRIPISRVKLLRPMTQISLMKIVKLKLRNLSRFFSRNEKEKTSGLVKALTEDTIGTKFKVIMSQDFENIFFKNNLFQQDARDWIKEEIAKGRIIPERGQILSLSAKMDSVSGKFTRRSFVVPDTDSSVKVLVAQGKAREMTFDEFEGKVDSTSLDFISQAKKDVVLAEAGQSFPSFKLNPSEALVEFLSTYDQTAEDGGRKIDNKLKSMIEKTIQDAYFAHQMQIHEGDELHLDVQKNQDGTADLVVNGQRLKIQDTEKSRLRSVISNERIDELVKMEEEINVRVKGVSPIVKRIVKTLLASANTMAPRDDRFAEKRADISVFLGTSSTGKTELAKALNAALYKTSDPVKVIDFSNVQTYEDVRKKILGSWDPVKQEEIPSEFMQSYDRHQGDFMIVFDEVSNANPEVLRALYDILREPVVQTFSDGKPRAMGQVKIVMTGNAGEEWYKVIPRDIPEAEQYEAAQEIYNKVTGNAGYLRGFLQKFFSEAFLNRIGMDNIYFFGPHTYANVYSLFQLKLVKALESISSVKEGTRTWKVRFKTESDHKKLLDFMAHHQFHLWEQGASIDRAVKEFSDELTQRLFKSKTPVQSEVLLSFGDVLTFEDKEKTGSEKSKIEMHIEIPSQNLKLYSELVGKTTPKETEKNKKKLLLIAYHEAGHEIVRKVLLKEYFKSEGIKIIPGIAEIGGQFIHYLGLAESSETLQKIPTLEYFVREIAVLMGGASAEALVSNGGVISAGGSNDKERATLLAQHAILRYGLMPAEWGHQTLQRDQDIDSFMKTQTEGDKKKIKNAIDSLLNLGDSLARKALIANFDNLLLPMGSALAKKGKLDGEEIEKMYSQTKIIRVEDHADLKAAMKSYDKKVKAESPSLMKRLYNKFVNFIDRRSSTTSSVEPQLYSFVAKPDIVVDLPALLKQQKEEAHAKVDLSAANQFIQSITPTQTTRKCAEILLHR